MRLLTRKFTEWGSEGVKQTAASAWTVLNGPFGMQ